MAQRFRQYVQEAGLKWDNYESYLPKNWRNFLEEWGLTKEFLFNCALQK